MTTPKRTHRHGALATNTTVGGMLGMRQQRSRNGNKPERQDVLNELLEVQRTQGAIDDLAIKQIAAGTATSEASVRGTASFYSLIRLDEDSARLGLPTVRVCDGPCCRIQQGQPLQQRYREVLAGQALVERTSCLGYCDQAPAVMIDQPDGARYVTGVEEASTETLDRLPPRASGASTQLLGHPNAAPSRRPLTKRFGIDPHSIEAALSAGVYQAFTHALATNSESIIGMVEDAGLRGRGGAGFLTGKKWRACAAQPSNQRYVICNADESEPGTFKDRMLMECDPHTLLEGMAICGRAIGATKGIIYIRGEYTHAAAILENAIKEAHTMGFLGNEIQGHNFRFDIAVHRGAGAYICGEETALLESLEGKRGEPRQRPPFPTAIGFQGKPTVVNNVETLCNVPSILQEGAELYRNNGRGEAFGTRLFCLSGHVAQAGLCEAPNGISLKQVIHEFGGGMRVGSKFKFALTGGGAGTFVSEESLDVPLDDQSMRKGVAVGSGAIIVADQSVNVPEMLLWILRFFEYESCGKCTPCRIGTVQARHLVERIVLGQGARDDIDELLRIANTLKVSAFCGLGESVAWPIESAITHFHSDFETW